MRVHVPPALKRRIEAHMRNAELAEAGRKLVCDDIVSIQGFPEAEVRLFDNWAVDPFGSRSWQWAVAAFRFMPAVIAWHSSSGEDAALDWAFRALESWQKAIRGPLRRYEFARNDHAVANQAESLVHLLAYLELSGLRPDGRERVAEAVHGHAELLSSEEFYSRHTNHGIEQARILAVIADFFPEHPASPAHLELAVERLLDELDFAFTKEGVHVENSPGYHAYVCLSFIKIRDYFPVGEIEALAERIDALMPRAMRFLVHVTRPDGTLPLIGDTANETVPNYFRRYRKIRDYTHLRYVATDGEEGVPSPQTSVLYPQAGYCIVRDRWPPPGQARDAFHLVFRCGYRSRYHRHDDDLNLVLYCGGEDWLIDSGIYRYAEQDPLRLYMRSKWAHNVPVVHRPAAKRWTWEAPHAVLPLKRLPAQADGVVAVRGITHTYPGHVAMRDLHVNAPAREFTVTDSLIQAGKPARRRYLSLWHVPADKDIEVDGQAVLVRSRQSGQVMVIENLGGRAKHIGLVDPEVPGVEGVQVSRAPNTTEPAQLLAFEWQANHLHAMLRFRLPTAALPHLS